MSWKNVAKSEEFQQLSQEDRQAVRGEYFDSAIRPKVPEGQSAAVQSEFFTQTESDVFGERDTNADSDSLSASYGGGLSDQRALEEQGKTEPKDAADADSGEFYTGLLKSGLAGIPASFGATAEGMGMVVQQADIAAADKKVDNAERHLSNMNERLDAALQDAPQEQREEIRSRYASAIQEREDALGEATKEWVEREPNKAAGWLRNRGVDLKELSKEIDVDPEQRTWANDLAGAAGSIVSYLGPGLLARLATRGSVAAGSAAAVGMAAPAGVSESYDRAISAGLDEEEALDRSMAGLAPGAIQVAPLASLLKPLPKDLQSKAVGQLYGVLRTGGAEATVEGAGAVLQNLIEQNYNPERGTWDDAGYRAAIGGGAGGVVQAGTQLATRGRGVGGGDKPSGKKSPEDPRESAEKVSGEAVRGDAANKPELAELQGAPRDAEPGRAAQENVAAPPQTEEDAGSRLIRANAETLQPAEQKARERLAAGDGYAMLRERAEDSSNQAAVDAIDRMQVLFNEGDTDGSADAYLQARQALNGDHVKQGLDANPDPSVYENANYTDAEVDQAWEEQAASPQSDIDRAAAETDSDATTDSQPENFERSTQARESHDAERASIDEELEQSRDGDVLRVPTDRINIDPEQYQFRSNVGKSGTDSRLSKVSRWDDRRAGNLLLHQRNDGSLYAADGHHRVDLARRLNQPDVNAQVLRESDGYGVDDARKEASLANIADGNATAIDAAKVFRNSDGDVRQIAEDENLPDSQLVRDGASIANLGDDAFGNVVNGQIGEKDGAAIGASFDDADHQAAAAQAFKDVQPQNANQRALLINEVRQAGFADSQSEQGGLFGDDPSESLIKERVRVMDRLRQQLLRDKRLFATLNTNADKAEGAGNAIDRNANNEIKDASASAIDLLDRAATTPELNSAINDAARRVHSGEPVNKATKELRERFVNGTQTRSSAASPDNGGAPDTAGQAKRGSEPDRSGNAARGASEIEQSGMADERQESIDSDALPLEERRIATDSVSVKADGQPFQTRRAVQLSKRFRDTPGAQPVEVSSGWGFTTQADRPARTSLLEDAPADLDDGPLRHFQDGAPGIGIEPVGLSDSRNTSVVMRDEGGKPIGALSFRVRDDGAIDTEHRDGLLVNVAPGHRRQGVATALYDAASEAGFDVDSLSGRRVLSQDGKAFSDARRSSRQAEPLAPEAHVQQRPGESERGTAQGQETNPAEGASETEVVDDSPLLETYTEQDIAARERDTQQAEKAETDRRRQEGQRVDADREADDFNLTGSDRAADVNAAGGQQDLMGGQPEESGLLSADTEGVQNNAESNQGQPTREHRYSLDKNAAEHSLAAEDIASVIRDSPELANTTVIQSAKELPPEALIGMTLRGVNPRDVRGMYIGDDLYVIADNVDSVEDGVQTAVHEAVGHKGIRGVLGEELDPVMRQLYKTLPLSRKGREALNEVLDTYAFLDRNSPDDQVTIGEEMVAHLLEKGQRPKAWQRAVAKIKELLRRHFPSVPWSTGDVLDLGEKSREWLHRRQAEADDGQASDITFAMRSDAGEGDARRPEVGEVQASIKGVPGAGRATVLNSADNIALDVALESTISGVDPQEAIAFYHGDKLYVVADNARDTAEAKRATLATITGRDGIRKSLDGRADHILRDFLSNAQRNMAGRNVIREVTAEFDHLSLDHQNDKVSLAAEALSRLGEQSAPPAFAKQAGEKIDALLSEMHPDAEFSVGDGVGMASANRHHLLQQQRDFGEGRPPYALPFVFSSQDGPGRGTLLDMNTQVVDANGDIISDAKIDGAIKSGAKAGQSFFESATDRLRRSKSPVLNELARRTDAFFDQAEARMGLVNGILREPLKEVRSLRRKKRRQNMTDFEAYMRHRDNGRADKAAEISARNPAVAELIDAVDTMFDQVGTINQTVKTPQGTGMRVFDSRTGAYRKIGKVTKGNFWPRALRPEVQRVMHDPTSNNKLWHELLDSLVDEGRAANRKEAAEYLRGNSGYFSGEIASDYFAGIEKARGEKLPEIFYDYKFDVVTSYARKWSERISQVEQFGQKIGPYSKDSFEEAASVARDKTTQDYIGWLADRVYNRRPTDAYHEAMAIANLAATGLQLGNPGTATLNVIGGTQLNVQMFGGRRMVKAYAELARDYKEVYREGVELGILGKDVLNILRDADNRSTEYMDTNSRLKEGLSTFAAGTMKWGGYTGTEQVIRATGMLGARAQLMDALKAWNATPYSKTSRTYRNFMERNRIDVAKLIRENGKGEETARYLRLMVNIPQGSYRVDQTPLYVDTPMGRFFFKYQKFGTQVSRLFWQQKLKPFMDIVKDPSATSMDRAKAFLPIMQWLGWATLGGAAILAARGAMFGYLEPGPELDEIAKAFEDDDTAEGWGMIASKAHANLTAGSAYGFFGNYLQMGLDIADQQRVKNPFEPPGMAAIEAPIELLRRWQEQNTLYAADWEQVAERQVAIYRAGKRGLLSLGNQAGFEADAVQLEQARRDLQYIRKAARRYADKAGIDATRTSTGRFGLTENTAENREIADAILIGDGARARELVREAVRSADPGEDRKRRLQSIRSTVRARHPVQMGGPASKDEIDGFRKWAKEKLPDSKVDMVEDIIKRYENASWKAGL